MLFLSIYIHKDRRIADKDLKQIKELEYKGIIVTVDAPVIGRASEREEHGSAFTGVCLLSYLSSNIS